MKKRLLFIIATLGLLIISTAIPAISGNIPKASAATIIDTWITTKGSITPIDVPFGRFEFKSPFEIKDNVTKDVYKTSASVDNIFGDGKDHDDLFRANKWWWYWPEGKQLKKDDKNRCYGGIAVRTYKSRLSPVTYVTKAEVYLVQPDPRRSGADCYVPKAEDVEGLGGDPDDPNEWNLTNYLNGDDKRNLATPFYWEAGKLRIWDTDLKPQKAEAGVQSYLETQTKKVYSGADKLTYYYVPKCVNDKDEPEAWVGIASGDKATARVYHRRGNDINYEWDGDQLACMFGRDISQGPRSLIGGSTKTAGLAIAYPENSTADSSQTPVPGSSVADEEGDGTDKSCGGGSGGGALRWILCPILDAVNEGIQWATDNVIGPSLEMKPLENGGTLYEAWQSLRNLANAFLVVIFLLVIFANFFASEQSSYTVKKTLPRLVAAAILIQLSYFFCAVLIDIGNVLGNGIGTLILQATGGSAGGSGASVGANIASGLLVGGSIAGGIVIATILGAWMLLLPLVIGLVISILTLVISLGVRLIALNLLIMLAPLALLAWVLPNTDKYFKMWTTNLVKLVMMYPMIIAMMAAAQVVVDVGANNSSDKFAGVLTLFAPMIAFFMIPATFKASGTVISGINGAIASKGSSFSKATAGKLRSNTLNDMKDKAAVSLYNTSGTKGFKRQLARVASGNALSFGATGRKKMRKTEEAGLAARTELQQHEWRETQNKPLMDNLLAQRAAGKLSRADEYGMLDLIASRGGTLELADYFAELEKEKKVTRGAKGGVEHIDDDIWGQLGKKHSAAIAAALPHTTGKAMQSQDGGGLNKAKGKHPARELKREFDEMVATGDVGAKQQLMQQFFDAAQRDDAGSMDKEMVIQLQAMLGDKDAADTELFTDPSGTKWTAKDLFTQQIKNGRMQKYVRPT